MMINGSSAPQFWFGYQRLHQTPKVPRDSATSHEYVNKRLSRISAMRPVTGVLRHRAFQPKPSPDRRDDEDL